MHNEHTKTVQSGWLWGQSLTAGSIKFLKMLVISLKKPDMNNLVDILMDFYGTNILIKSEKA